MLVCVVEMCTLAVGASIVTVTDGTLESIFEVVGKLSSVVTIGKLAVVTGTRIVDIIGVTGMLMSGF